MDKLPKDISNLIYSYVYTRCTRIWLVPDRPNKVLIDIVWCNKDGCIIPLHKSFNINFEKKYTNAKYKDDDELWDHLKKDLIFIDKASFLIYL